MLKTKITFHKMRSMETQELDVDFFILVYLLRSKEKDGHSAAAQIVSGLITP